MIFKTTPLPYPLSHFLHIVIPLLTGGMIYFLFRENHLLLFHWTEAIGITPILSSVRSVASPLGSMLPEWILYSLPGALWTYTFSFLITQIWAADPNPFCFVFISLPFVLSAGKESFPPV